MSGNIGHGFDSQRYSTNPNTIKARRRKMSLTGAQKHEDAARTADYKAMIYARKVVQEKPEYLAAPEAERTALLERAMREAMEKRRSKGQDTMSKMAAFHAGQRTRGSTTGPVTRVPIADFLVTNGYVPPSATRPGFNQDQTRHPAAGPVTPLSPRPTNTHLGTGGSSSSATLADMAGFGHGRESLPALNGLGASRRGPDSISSPNGPHSNVNPYDRGSNFFTGGSPPMPLEDSKPARVSAPLGDLIPEGGVMPSIEGDGSEDGQVVALRKEVAELRNMIQSGLASNSMHEFEVRDGNGGFDAESTRARDLNQRVCQLEGIVHALQNVSMTTIEARVTDLERIADQLQYKLGDGCEAEVGKMREVFGSLRGALEKVGDFL